jgi:hypothetical protein
MNAFAGINKTFNATGLPLQIVFISEQEID